MLDIVADICYATHTNAGSANAKDIASADFFTVPTATFGCSTSSSYWTTPVDGSSTSA